MKATGIVRRIDGLGRDSVSPFSTFPSAKGGSFT